MFNIQVDKVNKCFRCVLKRQMLIFKGSYIVCVFFLLLFYSFVISRKWAILQNKVLSRLPFKEATHGFGSCLSRGLY